MSNPIFNFDKNEPFFRISDSTAMDSKGNMIMKLDGNLSMDLKTGKLQTTTSWDNKGKNKK